MAIPKLRFKEFEDNWKETTLGNSVYIKSGYSPSKYKLGVNGEMPFLKVEELNNCSKYQEKSRFYTKNHSDAVPKESIIFPKRGAAILNNKVRILKVDALLDSNLMALTAKPNLDSVYLYYLIDHVKLYKIADTSTIPQINNKHIEPYNIYLPTHEEQTKIASFLSAVDDKIAQLTQEHELLSEYKKGMMQQLLSKKLRFKADDGSDFEDWEERKLSEVGENIIGLTYSPKDVTNDGSGILVLRSSNIKNGRLDKRDQVRVNKVIKDRIIIQQNDILICARNGSQRLIGKSVLIKDTERMTFGAFMSVYRSQYNHFISYLMQSSWFFEQVQMNLGARINQITTGTLNEFTFDFPTMEEQTKIANFLSAIDQKIDNAAAQIDQAQVWKKGLLQQMFV